MSSVQWTDERIEVLRRKIGQHKTARIATDEINAETGANFTRNAVIGKAHRLGLYWTFVVPKATITPVRRSRLKPPRPGRVTLPAQRKPPRQILEPLPTTSLFDQLQALKSHHCRWIEGGRYCGALTVRGCWCAEHSRAVFA